MRRWCGGRLALGAGLVAVGAVLATGTTGDAARAATRPPAPSEPSTLPGLPGAALLARGRVLVLRPHRLEIVLDGHLLREVPVEQPLDLARLPDVVGDAAFAARTAPGVVRVGAVLAQRPGTTVQGGTDGPLRLDLADTGGAGPARLTGTRAALRLRAVTVAGGGGAPGAVAAGLRYLHDSEVLLADVTLQGLGGPGPAGVPALRCDNGGTVTLLRVTLLGGGRGVEIEQPAALDVDVLSARGTGGDALTVVGGSGGTITAVTTVATAGAALRLRATRRTALAGLASTGDRRALVATDVAGLTADRVVAAGSGLLVGGRDVELRAPRVDSAVDALVVEGGTGVVVRGGNLRGTRDAVRTTRSAAVVLDRVTTHGAVHGATVRTATASTPVAASTWWRPVRGAGAVAFLVLTGAVVLEVAGSRRRRPAPPRESTWDAQGTS